MEQDDVIVFWNYGGIAGRDCHDRRYWNCFDSDYGWTSVIDDFGQLVAVSRYKNMRGY